MRFVTRTLAFVIVILLAFWFTAENSGEVVSIDFVFFRLRMALPLVVFSSVLIGMGLSTLAGWRAERRARRRAATREEIVRELRDPPPDFTHDYAAAEPDPVERSPLI